jgi:uncharacterized protein (TIGR00725 family)
MIRRPVVAVIGNAKATPAQCTLAEELGRLLVEHGCRVLTGGLGGVMEAASRGARSAANYGDGDVIGILPGDDAALANEFVDIAIPSGMGFARNVLIVRTAAAVIAVGGGAGTLSEIAHAWQADRIIVVLTGEGISGEFGGRALDDRPRPPILKALSARSAVELVLENLGARDSG